MDNLASKWKAMAQDKYGTIAAGIRIMNKSCDKSHTGSCINEMITGKRNVSACVQRFMLGDVLPVQLTDSGIHVTPDELRELREAMVLPERT